MKKIIALFLAICMVFVLAACGQQEAPAPAEKPAEAPVAEPSAEAAKEEIKITVGTVIASNGAWAVGLKAWQEKAAELSDGRIQIEIVWDSLLGDNADLPQSVSLGSVDACLVNTGGISNIYPDYLALDLPYLFSTSEQAYEVLDGPAGRALLDELLDMNCYALVWMENGFRCLANSARPIVHPEDIVGLKIRTLDSALLQEEWNYIGAIATPMAWAEVYTALETKVIDGLDNALESLYNYKTYEVNPYISVTNQNYSPIVLMINNDLWQSYSEEDRAILQEAAEFGRDAERQYINDLTVELVDKFEELGCTVSIVDVEEWKAAMQPVFDKNAESFDPALIAALTGK